MIKPEILETDIPLAASAPRGTDVWEAVCAANSGDAVLLERILSRHPGLFRGDFYTAPLHFAAREGHAQAVRVILNVITDAEAAGLTEELITLTRDRGHEGVTRMLEEFRDQLGRVVPADVAEDPPIHVAAEAGAVTKVIELLDAQPELVQSSDRAGGTPLHRAVAASSRDVVRLLLDRGAEINARHGAGRASERGYPAKDFEPIDLALWRGPFWGPRGDLETARLLIERGAAYDTAIAAAVGDRKSIERFLATDPSLVNLARPCGKRALSTAVEYEHHEIIRLLLESGADPNLPEGANAPRGAALHTAARRGDLATVELLLAHGADPNSYIDSSGSATYAAATRELRALLMSAGGTLDTYDLVWLGEDDEVIRRVKADPASANSGCGGVFTAAATEGKRELVVRLIEAGARVPPVVTACRSYLWSDPGILRLLLDSGMDPNLPNWHRATPLHDLCGRDSRGRTRDHRLECATILLEAGADICARDEDYLSTPLAWAARNDLPDMVEFLLANGAPTNLADEEPWTTPLSWAERRGHVRISELLKRAGATV